MTCRELKDDYEMYALGLLEGEADAEAEEHVRRGCDACLQSLREAIRLNTYVLTLVPEVPVPERLRGRVISLAGVRRGRGLVPLWAGLAAASLAVAAWTYSRELRMTRELGAVQQRAQQGDADLARLGSMLDVLHLPETRQVVFGTGERQPPGGRVFIHPTRGALLLARNLPPVPAGKTYEMWLIPKTGAPQPAGLFQPDVRGVAAHYASQQLEWASAAAVAVSVEPAAGSASPTTTPIIVAPLSD